MRIVSRGFAGRVPGGGRSRGRAILERLERQADQELAPQAASGAARLHGAAVERHQAAHQGQAQAQASFRPLARALHLGERLEDPRQHVGRDPHPGVADADHPGLPLAPHDEADRAAAASPLARGQSWYCS